MKFTEAEYAQLLRKRENRSGELPAAKAKRPKYGNVRTEGSDSKKEHMRKVELELMVKAGLITGLRHQISFAMVHEGQLICQYIADHVYEIEGITVVEDTKSPPTRKDPVYVLKKKMMRIFHRIEISEV